MPKRQPYPRNPGSLADLLTRRRLERGLRQKDAAAEIGVGVHTWTSWETGTATPAVR
ncbi:MAG: helix-turn-helix transcriptional regulator [Proteobacteria bacterium]|nr:helix-turn-helix transcriptional regulator [Pseudomonadota bacterium]